MTSDRRERSQPIASGVERPCAEILRHPYAGNVDQATIETDSSAPSPRLLRRPVRISSSSGVKIALACSIWDG